MKPLTTETYSFDHTISICDILTAVNVNSMAISNVFDTKDPHILWDWGHRETQPQQCLI